MSEAIKYNQDIISWKNQPVFTFELAGHFFGNDPKIHKDNFNNNRERYREGDHYFKLQGSDLKEFLQTENCSVANPSKVRHLILLTQKGVARLAKSCGSERAWEVFEELEETYFKVQSLKEMADDPNILIDLLIQNRSELQQKVKILEATKAQISTSREAQVMARYSHVKHHELIESELRELQRKSFGFYKPSDIGGLVEDITGKSCSAQKVNKCLIQMGFQTEDKFYTNGKYSRKVIKTHYTHKLSTSGKYMAVEVKNFNNGATPKLIGSYKWKPEIAQMIASFLTKKEASNA